MHPKRHQLSDNLLVMIDLEEFGKICKSNNALFHSDTVQTIGHYNIDLDKINIDFMTCSAHKFHGPKGVGFAYIRNGQTVKTFIDADGKERLYGNERSPTPSTFEIKRKVGFFSWKDLYKNQSQVVPDSRKWQNFILIDKKENCFDQIIKSKRPVSIVTYNRKYYSSSSCKRLRLTSWN